MGINTSSLLSGDQIPSKRTCTTGFGEVDV
jgi:hypothetical protein